MEFKHNNVIKPISSNGIMIAALIVLLIFNGTMLGNYGISPLATAQNNSNSTLNLWSDKLNVTNTGGILDDDIIIITPPNDTLAEGDLGALSDSFESIGTNVQELPNSGILIVNKSGDEDALSTLSEESGNSIAEPNRLRTMHSQTIPMGVDRIDADRPNSVNPSNSSVVTNNTERNPINATIGILDTGIDLDNPDLNVVGNVSFVPGAPTGDDDEGHGTHVAGIAAAKDNDYGVVGVAPGAKLIAIKVLNEQGAGSTQTILNGLEYVLANIEKFDVINLSLGGYGISNAESSTIAKIVKAGVPVVVSAGNEDTSSRYMSPASTNEAIVVSAMYDSDGKCGELGPSMFLKSGENMTDDSFAIYSNHGEVEVDIMAPGTANSTLPGGLFDVYSGTSMAAPHVTGAIALIQALSPDNPSSDEIEDILMGNSIYRVVDCEPIFKDGQGYLDMTRDDDDADEPLLYSGLFTKLSMENN